MALDKTSEMPLLSPMAFFSDTNLEIATGIPDAIAIKNI